MPIPTGSSQEPLFLFEKGCTDRRTAREFEHEPSEDGQQIAFCDRIETGGSFVEALWAVFK